MQIIFIDIVCNVSYIVRNKNKMEIDSMWLYNPLKLKELRKKEDLTRAALARGLDVSPHIVKQWEIKRKSGCVKPSVPTGRNIVKLSNFFDINPGHFFEQNDA